MAKLFPCGKYTQKPSAKQVNLRPHDRFTISKFRNDKFFLFYKNVLLL